METIAFIKELKNLLNQLNDGTLSEILSHDKKYQETTKQLEKAKVDYGNLVLTDDQNVILQHYLQYIECSNIQHSIFCYLTGLMDNHQRMGVSKSPHNSNTIQKKHILQSFYNGEVVPDEQMRESCELKEYWNYMRNLEKCFEKKLNSEWKNEFNEILERRMESLSMYTNEEFVNGFQIGAKMMIGVYTMLN